MLEDGEKSKRQSSVEPLGLIHLTIRGDGGEVLLVKQLVKHVGTRDALDEDDDLVELEVVEEVDELAVLGLLLELDEVLLEAVEGELGAIVDVDLNGLGGGVSMT